MPNNYKQVFPISDIASDNALNSVLQANGLHSKLNMETYSKFNRFGRIDPYNSITGCREYLFFTKPDLHIVEPYSDILNEELKNQPYFVELKERYPDVISQLQESNGIGDNGPFMALLSNTVNNTLDLQAISSSVIDNPQTIYGTSYNYRGWGYTSDEKVEFSLEFNDTKYLEVYNLFKAYEEYERLKHLGMVTPPNIDGADVVNGKSFNYYIRNRILHDQFSVYKFIVEDDGKTIIYYAKLWGVFIKSVPRDAFSEIKAENGITYSVDFEAAFIDDMNPVILQDFNKLVSPYIDKTVDLPIYNSKTRTIDGTWARIPIVLKVLKKNNKIWNGPSKMNHGYELKWRV